jgi:hypothetical protein
MKIKLYEKLYNSIVQYISIYLFIYFPNQRNRNLNKGITDKEIGMKKKEYKFGTYLFIFLKLEKLLTHILSN